MPKSCIYALFLSSYLLAGVCVYGQQSEARSCDFAIFNRELKDAIKTSNAGKLALLVSYPLRINDARGSYYIKDAASLQGRFDDIFTAPVRKAVNTQEVGDSVCNTYKFMYGPGDVWVELTDQGYAITAVNVPDKQIQTKSDPRVSVTCRTDDVRIIVDILSNGTLRYRAWNKGHSLSQKPDTEFLDGKESIEGRGECAYDIWSFSQGTESVSIEGLGCANSPPINATGQLMSSTNAASWCF